MELKPVILIISLLALLGFVQAEQLKWSMHIYCNSKRGPVCHVTTNSTQLLMPIDSSYHAIQVLPSYQESIKLKFCNIEFQNKQIQCKTVDEKSECHKSRWGGDPNDPEGCDWRECMQMTECWL
ncbi:hypothetical protein BKA69DRAFT_1102494 [Paraphysoderma sedebokerense]|nr:hypothetical protein BKA69DRAFT_1105192 [Paraphysoderma sedebokerense]KAI9136673.1 hypothetical protein BKA69DRAFT_1102494 [Paraphysoderma sedebokerense]